MAKVQRFQPQQNEESEQSNYVSIADRALNDVKPPALVPSGSWLLRCLAAKIEKGTDRDDNIVEKFKFVHEPMEPTSSVDPDEAAAIDPETGRSPYDGKRVYTTLTLFSAADIAKVKMAILAHFDADETEGKKTSELVPLMRGRKVYGAVSRYTYENKQTRETRTDNEVKTWARVSDVEDDDFAPTDGAAA